MLAILAVVFTIVELMCSKEKMVVKTFKKKETKHGFCFVARTWMENGSDQMCDRIKQFLGYDSFSDVGEIRVYRRADFQSGSRVLKKVF